MLLKNPNFWYDKPSLLLKLVLRPFSYIYSFFAHRELRKAYKYASSAKVIAIGGATVGGSGKTIVAQALASLFLEKNKKVAFLSRGYARRSSDTRVVSEEDSYLDVGDEPLILSKVAPVIVGKNRALSAKIAEKAGASVLILDDGLAQRYLRPDINVLVIDSQQLFGNGYTLPLGPNRFALHVLRQHVDFVIFLRSSKCSENQLEGEKIHCSSLLDPLVLKDYSEWRHFSEVIIDASLAVSLNAPKRVVPFCGLGYPKKFFKSLSGHEIIKTFSFPDHYPYTDEDIIKLISFADENGAQLVTTEKDLARIPKNYHSYIRTALVEIIWNDSRVFDLVDSLYE